ncbi:MAG: hypothetical protein M1834_003977 [Cirrosporium novae-zelandiae]|nr:MAG: hypothetical protein M1834_003977 [Cirrosporium novae-zelandiae]
MSLKQEIETWVQALNHYDNNEFDEALRTFDAISDTSKILFNCGVIHATLGEHDKAVECYQRAVRLDQYFAVAYFQEGVSNFLLGDFEEALANFNDTLLYLRGNTYIDYDQLGLKFKLFSCEVLFNRGLCYIYLQQRDAGMKDLSFAVKEKVTPDHDVIDEAIREQAEGYTVFSIPVGIIYRPNEAKVKNLKTKDYLGKARLVAASDKSNAFTGFTGSERKQQRAQATAAQDDRPQEKISFAATNLVDPNLQSRARQQSEPPIHRNMFPPTPPPESDKQSVLSIDTSMSKPSMTSRAASVRSGGGPPPSLRRANTSGTHTSSGSLDSLGPPDRSMTAPDAMSRPRHGTIRTASEPRGGNSRKYSNPRPAQRERLFCEQLREDPVDEYQADKVYDMYRSPKSKRGSGRKPPAFIPEDDVVGDDGYDSDQYEGSNADEDEFDTYGSPSRSYQRRPSRTSSRRPDIRMIRVKVYADDTRFIMIPPSLEFSDFANRIREKFGLRRRFKCMMRDEGDMITMGDQDDLEMAIQNARKDARRAGSDVAKMEIWVEQLAS